MRSILFRTTDKFMDFCDRWSRAIACLAILFAFLVIIIPALLTCRGAQRVQIQPTEQQKKETNRLFKKHGVLSAVCDSDGQNCYFIRDGKKCRLI